MKKSIDSSGDSYAIPMNIRVIPIVMIMLVVKVIQLWSSVILIKYFWVPFTSSVCFCDWCGGCWLYIWYDLYSWVG